MGAIRWLAFACGLLLSLATWASVLETTVVPRGTRFRFTNWVLRASNLPVRLVAACIDDFERRDSFLAYAAAGYVMATVLVWLSLFFVAFSFMLWPFAALGDAFRVAGSSMLTLGIASLNSGVPTGIIYIAAFTGLVVVTLQIAYLPALYSAYNRRETLVTMLEGLAGAPGWGPEILSRSAVVDNLDGIGAIYDRWMEWSADVSESHSAYPVLMFFRSPALNRSWVISLLSILDAAAMHLALCPVSVPAPARNLMRVGYLAFRQLSGVLDRHVPSDPSPDDNVSISKSEFLEAAALVRAAGMEFERDPESAWIHFKGWRVNYEAAAYVLAAELDVVPALWSGPRPRPGPPVPPVRPVDRVSVSAEVTELLRVGELRRQRRRDQQSNHGHSLAADDHGVPATGDGE